MLYLLSQYIMISSQSPEQYGPDVHAITVDDRKILLVGTAHVSKESVTLVKKIINQEHPDHVCLELDEKRYQAMTQQAKWQSLDLKQIIRNKQLSTLLVSILMASYQKRLGGKLGVLPGSELLAGATTANELQIPISLCDRDVRITLRRAWKSTPFLKKCQLIAVLFASIFDDEEIDAEKLEELKKKDILANLMDEMGDSFPDLKRVLIDERDLYLAEKIKTAPGQRLVAVVGAGHVEGIKKAISSATSPSLPELDTIPPVSKLWKVLGWGIPLLILGSLFAIGITKGADVAGSNLLFWILANGIPAAIGAVFALAHPVTIIGAFAAAPITSLTPVIGAGYVSAFIQVMKCPPVVREFENVANDITSITAWWKNKLLRVFLVFFLTGLGSAIGTWVGGYEIFKNLFH